MIVEEFPEIEQLSPDRKLALAAELFEGVTDCAPEDADPEIVRLLEERLAEYEKNPSSGSPWGEVKARILGSRDF
ncbi:MAG: addiction module protein [Verrucomicrobiae bacterium]|nr:addiction module protein [Verrucomicrobiae bacterium]MCP5539909.1 addiction module protein [Akkermansiaceae bacterium]MCP5551792.1 addiction module protein [Akkermansiaceae bacterium]